jgi:hypothetical protein
MNRRSILCLGKTALVLSSLALAGVVSGCNNNNNNAGGISSPEAFVNQLLQMSKNGTIPAGYKDSALAKSQSNQAGYFVIWDAQDQKYMAVNLNTYNQGTLDQAVAQFVQTDVQNPAMAGVLVTPDGSSSGGNPLYISANGTVYSHETQTRDVDLQRTQVENSDLLKTAAAISNTFQMSMTSAVQVATLADKMNTLKKAQNQLTPDDLEAVSQGLAGIAGVTETEIHAAISAGLKGDDTVANAVIAKAANALGMPSAATLRTGLLIPTGVISN